MPGTRGPAGTPCSPGLLGEAAQHQPELRDARCTKHGRALHLLSRTSQPHGRLLLWVGSPGGLRPGLVSSHLPVMKLEAEERPSPISGDSDPAPHLAAGWARQQPGRVRFAAPVPSGPAAENSSAEAEVLVGLRPGPQLTQQAVGSGCCSERARDTRTPARCRQGQNWGHLLP